MSPDEKTILGCILTPALVIVGPIYALALLFAWPVVLPLTGLLAFMVWNWNRKAKKRAAQFPNEMQEAHAILLAQQAQPWYGPRMSDNFGLPAAVAVHHTLDSLSDDDEMI